MPLPFSPAVDVAFSNLKENCIVVFVWYLKSWGLFSCSTSGERDVRPPLRAVGLPRLPVFLMIKKSPSVLLLGDFFGFFLVDMIDH